MSARTKMSGSDTKIHLQFKTYGTNAKLWLRKCAFLLPEIEKQRIWQKKGFASIYEYAAKLAGMNHKQVNEALRVLAKIEDKPELQKVAEQKGINAVKPVISIATQETEKFWAEKAATMSKNTLETYIREFKKENAGVPRNQFQITTEKQNEVNQPQILQSEMTSQDKPLKKTVGMELTQDVLQKLEKLKGQGSWNDLFQQLLKEREGQLEKEKPEPVKIESRYIPAKITNYVMKRTNGQCAFPQCIRPYDDIHHTQRFSLTHVHDPDHLQILCKSHHMLAHYGLIDNEDCGTENWRILLEPDTDANKFQIDQIVQKYKRAAS